MSCPICERDEQKKVALYGHTPAVIHVCNVHSWEIFVMGERRFMKKYKQLLAGQFRPTAKKASGGGNSTLGQTG